MGQIEPNEAEQIVISEDVFFEKVGDELVLLQLESGEYYGLNRVGRRIWEVLVETRNPRIVLERLQQEYDVTEPMLRADIDALLGKLSERNLISGFSAGNW